MAKLTDEQKAMLLWKLGPGDMNKTLRGENPIPEKKVRATETSWGDLQPMSEKRGRIHMGVKIMKEAMEALKMGHVPEVQEDHWFMYCTDDTIRFYRSWSGACIYEAHFADDPERDDCCVIDILTVTLDWQDVPPMGPRASGDLFMMLVAAEIGADWYQFWEQYLQSQENGE